MDTNVIFNVHQQFHILMINIYVNQHVMMNKLKY